MKNLGIFLIVVGTILGSVYPTYYWWCHDSLTPMQLFKALPLQILGGTIFVWIGYAIAALSPILGFFR